jgi:hypothetical protein
LAGRGAIGGGKFPSILFLDSLKEIEYYKFKVAKSSGQE